MKRNQKNCKQAPTVDLQTAVSLSTDKVRHSLNQDCEFIESSKKVEKLTKSKLRGDDEKKYIEMQIQFIQDNEVSYVAYDEGELQTRYSIALLNLIDMLALSRLGYLKERNIPNLPSIDQFQWPK